MSELSTLAGFATMNPLLVVSRFPFMRWTPLLERVCQKLRDEGIPVLQVGECPASYEHKEVLREHFPGIARIDLPTATNWHRRPLEYLRARRRFSEHVGNVVQLTQPRAAVFENADLAGIALKIRMRYPNLSIIYWASELSCRFIQAPFRRHERFLAPFLSGLVMNHPGRVEAFCQRVKRNVPNIVLPNTETRVPEGICFKRQPVRELFSRHNPEVKVILLYNGAVSHMQAILEVVKALTLVPPHVGLAFSSEVGNPRYLRKIRRTIKQLGLERRIIHLAWVPFDQVPEVSASADVGIALYNVNDLNTLYCASSKLYRYLCVGLPVIGSSLPAIADIIQSEKIGVTCNQKSHLDIARAIHKLADDQTRNQMAANARIAFDRRLCLEVQWARHRETFSAWIGNGRQSPEEIAKCIRELCRGRNDESYPNVS